MGRLTTNTEVIDYQSDLIVTSVINKMSIFYVVLFFIILFSKLLLQPWYVVNVPGCSDKGLFFWGLDKN